MLLLEQQFQIHQFFIGSKLKINLFKQHYQTKNLIVDNNYQHI